MQFLEAIITHFKKTVNLMLVGSLLLTLPQSLSSAVDPVKQAMDEALATPPVTDIGLYYDLGGAMPIPVGGTTRVKIKFDPSKMVNMNLGCDGFGVFTSMESVLEDTKNSIFSAYQGIVNFATQGIMKLALFTVVQTGAPDLYNALMELLEKAKRDYDIQLGQCADIEEDILNTKAQGLNFGQWGTAFRDSFRNEAAFKIYQASSEGKSGGELPSIHDVIEKAKIQSEEEGLPCPCDEEKKCLGASSTFDLIESFFSCGYDRVNADFDPEHPQPLNIKALFPEKEDFITFAKDWLGEHIIETDAELNRKISYTDGYGGKKMLADISYQRNETILEAIKLKQQEIATGDFASVKSLQMVTGDCETTPITNDIMEFYSRASRSEIVDFSAKMSARQAPAFAFLRGKKLIEALLKVWRDPNVREINLYAITADRFKSQLQADLLEMVDKENPGPVCKKLGDTYKVFSDYVFNKNNAAASISTPSPSNAICVDATGNIEACPSSGVQSNPGLQP